MEYINIIKTVPLNNPITIHNSTHDRDVTIYGFAISENGTVGFIENEYFSTDNYNYKEESMYFNRYKGCRFVAEKSTPSHQTYFGFFDE
jgi:hypothetical protein